jgi:hypothetical protein
MLSQSYVHDTYDEDHALGIQCFFYMISQNLKSMIAKLEGKENSAEEQATI